MAVPLPLSVKVDPGRQGAGLGQRGGGVAGGGHGEACRPCPSVKVVGGAVVIRRRCRSTVRVKVWVASGWRCRWSAVMVSG